MTINARIEIVSSPLERTGGIGHHWSVLITWQQKEFLGLKKTKKYAKAEYDGEGGRLITKTGLVGFETGKFKNKFALGPNQKSKVYWTRNIETSPSD